MGDDHAPRPPSRWAVTATVLFYMFAAIAMVIVNKWVLNATKVPLFFLLAQLVIAVLMFILTSTLGIFKLTLTLDYQVCQGLVPMIVINVVGLSSNNYCLKYVDASFYQIARGLVLPLTVVFSVLFLHSPRPSLRVLTACAVVTIGFFVGIFLDGSPNSPSSGPSPLGVLFGLISSCTTAVHAVVIKRSLTLVKGDAIELAWYSNVLSSMLLIPVIWLVGEGPDIVDLIWSPASGNTEELTILGKFLWGSLVTGLVGWLLSIAGVLSIKITSPITHMVSAAVRGILQSLLGVWVFGDIITTGRGTSIAVILGGSTYYTWVKNEELMKQRGQSQFSSSAHGRDLERGRNGDGYIPVPLEDLDRTSRES